MIAVEVWMWPGGSRARRHLLSVATLVCCGARPDGERAYIVRLLKDATFGGPTTTETESAIRDPDARKVWRIGQIRGHYPGARGVWDLLGGALRQLVGDRLGSYTPLAPEDAPPVLAPAVYQDRGGIYGASRASIPARAELWRAVRAAEHPLVSTWIDAGPAPDMVDLWVCGVREAAAAERLILYVEPGDLPLKGAYVEVGVALGAGAMVFVVAPDVADDALGSWIAHPNVRRVCTIADALAAEVPRAD